MAWDRKGLDDVVAFRVSLFPLFLFDLEALAMRSQHPLVHSYDLPDGLATIQMCDVEMASTLHLSRWGFHVAQFMKFEISKGKETDKHQ